MSLIIKNIAGTVIEIDDIGITLEIGQSYDLIDESAQDIATSVGLTDAVTAGDIIALDPLDGLTPLTEAQSIEAIQASNDTHYRIKGGALSQLDDVDTTGFADAHVLTYVAANNQWEPKPATGGGNGACFPFYKADTTYDPIVVTAGQFPFFKADGTQDNITIAVCV